jgi:hypothetical protein
VGGMLKQSNKPEISVAALLSSFVKYVSCPLGLWGPVIDHWKPPDHIFLKMTHISRSVFIRGSFSFFLETMRKKFQNVHSFLPLQPHNPQTAAKGNPYEKDK